jgi:hypothetical protein
LEKKHNMDIANMTTENESKITANYTDMDEKAEIAKKLLEESIEPKQYKRRKY